MGTDKKRKKAVPPSGGGGAVYGLGLIGAAIFYIQQASGFGSVVLAVLKALVWPAFVVHDALKLIS
jgi:hypothetical protein